MTCLLDAPGVASFLHAFQRRAEQAHIPLSGGVAWTERCNLRCAHCFVCPGDHDRAEELSTEEWKRLLTELAAAGCLYLLVTGGEPFLREDFPALYTHARTQGMVVTVFTNATQVREEVLTSMRMHPPRAVEVSLYGATPEVYESITGVPGSFARCVEGIERMLAAGLPVRLKTMLMTRNAHELEAMEAMARAWGVRFRFDAMLTPDLQGGCGPARCRVAARDAVQREMAEPARVEEWLRFIHRFDRKRVKTRLYDCGAGLSTFFIDAQGWLSPCQMARTVQWDARRRGFLQGWNEVMPSIREQPMPDDWPCVHCEARVACSYCAAAFALEHEDGRPPAFVCEVAKQRLRFLDACEGEADAGQAHG